MLLSLRSNRHFEPPFSGPELLNAKELNRHVLQARCRHGPEQYSAICSRVQKIDLRQQFCTAEAHSGIAHTLASNAPTHFFTHHTWTRRNLFKSFYVHLILMPPNIIQQKISWCDLLHAAKSHRREVHSNASNAAMRFFSDTFLSGHTGERLYECKYCCMPCMWNTQSSLIVNFGHKNKSKYFFIYRNHIGYTGACPGTSLVNRWHDDISKMQYKTKIEIYGLYREG